MNADAVMKRVAEVTMNLNLINAESSSKILDDTLNVNYHHAALVEALKHALDCSGQFLSRPCTTCNAVRELLPKDIDNAK